jgi:hypothetical protein
MALGEWDDAGERFGEISIAYPESSARETAVFLQEKSDEAHSLPRRSPAMASVFSAVLPGTGQMYAHRTYDGVRHLLLNGLLGYLIYRAAEDENYAGTYLLAGIALPFYMGNVLGAKKSADQFNTSKRIEYVGKAIEATTD